MVAVCKYFRQGNCRFGDNCRNEHPGRSTAGSSGNRFGALDSGFGGQSSKAQQSAQKQPELNVTPNDIKLDLTAGKGRPEWVFSAYAPVRDVPRQLFGGPQREVSMEEMRLRHYEAAAAGNANLAIQEAQSLWGESVNQIEAALRDLNGAVKYIMDGRLEHPNRLDIVEGRTGLDQNQPSAFGQNPTFGAPSGPFGNAPSTSTGFPQPAPGGQPPPGQPSPFGQPSGFGQPSALGTGSAFGKASLGPGGFTRAPPNMDQAPVFGQSGFGKPSAPASSPFGLVGQNNVNQPPFGGQPAAQPTPSPFGPPTTQRPPGPPGFGQPSAPSGFGQSSQNAPPFGQPQQPTGPAGFGQTSGPSAFGQPPQKTSPFGQPQQPSGPAGFGQPSQYARPFCQPQQPTGPAGFGQPPAPSGFGQPPQTAQPVGQPADFALQGETKRDPMTTRLVAWKGRPVQYINDWPCYLHPQDNKTYVRINFPDGPPDDASLRDSQPKPEEYTKEIDDAYNFFLEHGRFEEDIIPVVPPVKEKINFDF